MNVMQRLRMPIDIAMTVLSIVLMGGTMLFPDDRVHQILGMFLLVLWAVHIALNHRWYGSVFKGRYNPFRVMQTVVNVGILVCAVLLGVSGMMMAWFIPETVSVPLGFARMAHLVSSHWYYLFMCVHVGMHVSIIFNKIKAKRSGKGSSTDSSGTSKMTARSILFRLILVLVCGYGVYACAVRGLWKYMFLLQPFFFFDMGRGYLLFVLDYISILVLIAVLSHLLSRRLLKASRSKS